MSDKWRFPIDGRSAIVKRMGWATIMIFVLGIGNFAINRAVFESGHPLIARLPGRRGPLAKPVVLGAEFAVLFFALLLSANGWTGFAYAYGVYTLFNGAAAWLMLTGRV